MVLDFRSRDLSSRPGWVIVLCSWVIAEFAEHSPIIIQNSSSPSSRKNLDVQPYKVLLLTCMVNCTAGTPMPWLCPVVQWSVHWAPSQTTHVLVMARARRCTLETCGKKMRAPLLGLAKSVYYTLLLLTVPFSTQEYRWVPANCQGSLKNLAMDWHSIKGGVTVITPSDYVLRKLG